MIWNRSLFPGEETEDDEEDIEDFRTPADIAPIRHDLQSSLFSLNVRIAVVAVLFIGTLYLALAQTAGLPLPAFMIGNTTPHYMIVNLALVIISALVCNTTVGGGLASLLTMHADGDSLAALAVISTIVQE